MSKTYKELTAQMTKRGMENVSDATASAIDAITRAPVHALEKAQNAKESAVTKAQVIATTIEAKLLIQDRMLGEVNDSEFAYRLAEDENLRKTVSLLAQQVLQPTPVENMAARTDNPFINIGAGLSAYWAEMQKKLPIEIENVVEIENVLMNVNAGLDKGMEPDTRKLFLKEAGMTKEQVDKLVPISDYVEYENRLKDVVRMQVMTEFGIHDDKNLTDEERLLIDSMTEDRMMGIKMQIDPGDYHEPTYEDVYGISAQDMYELFGDASNVMGTPDKDGRNVAVDDPEWRRFMEAAGAEGAYQAILNDTIENNVVLLASLVAPGVVERTDIALTEADLKFANAIEQNDDFMQGITEADLAFAEQFEQMEGIHEEDLAFAEPYVEENPFEQ